jgi:hypothetical protein
MYQTVKSYVIGFLVRWVLKIGGGALISIGITEGSIVEIVTAVVMLIIGVIISLIQHKKIAYTNHDDFFLGKTDGQK